MMSKASSRTVVIDWLVDCFDQARQRRSSLVASEDNVSVLVDGVRRVNDVIELSLSFVSGELVEHKQLVLSVRSGGLVDTKLTSSLELDVLEADTE